MNVIIEQMTSDIDPEMGNAVQVQNFVFCNCGCLLCKENISSVETEVFFGYCYFTLSYHKTGVVEFLVDCDSSGLRIITSINILNYIWNNDVIRQTCLYKN